MATSVTVNGTTYSVPSRGDSSWSGTTGVDGLLIALSNGTLQKAGGSFTLTAEVNFGATYGAKIAYVKSQGTNPSTTGIVRLANAESISWRNAANSADLALKVNSSNVLEYNGNPITSIALGTANQVLGMNNGATANEYKTISGTSNQVSVTHGTGTITLAAPQNIHSAATPTFAGMTLTSFAGALYASAGVLAYEAQLSGTRGGTGVSNSGTLTYGANNITFTTAGVTSVTLPTSGTLATLAGSETFTNKTLTNPLITTGGGIDVTTAGSLTIGASVGANNLTLGGASSTVVVAGNLQIDGTTTTVNSTTLDIDDKNITVSKGGNDAASEGAGLTVDRTGTKGSLIYKDASATKFAIGAQGSEDDVVGKTVTQTLTNKTLTSPTINTPTIAGGTATALTGLAIRDTSAAYDVTIAAASSSALTAGRTLTLDLINAARSIKLAGNIDLAGNLTTSGAYALTLTQTGATNVTLPTTGTLATLAGTETVSNKTFSDAITVAQIATPSNPSSGYNKIYPKTDGLLYKLDSSGNEVLVGSGAGAGELNLVINPDGDTALDGSRTNDVGDWIDSGSGTTSSKTTTAAEIPLYPLKTNAIKIENDGALTDYTYLRMTLPTSLIGRKLKIAWEQIVSTSPAYASGDFKLQLYTNASSNYGGAYTAVALSTDVSGVTSIPAANGRFQTTFDATSAIYLEMRITRVSGSADSYIALNNVVVGPGIQPQGAVVGRSETVTVTGSWSSNTTYTAVETRIGQWAHYTIKVALSGAPTSASLSVNLPSDRTIDTTALANSAASSALPLPNSVVGILDDGTASYQGWAVYSSTTAVLIKYLDDAASGVAITADVTQAAPFTFASGDIVNISFSVPIAEWAGSGTVNLAQADSQEIAIAYNSSTDSGLSLSTFNTVDFDTEVVDLGGRFSSDTFTAANAGYYQVDSSLHIITGTSFSRCIISIFKNGAEEVRCVDDPTARGAGADVAYTISSTVKLAVGDQITIRVYAAGVGTYSISGGSTDTRVTIKRISVDGQMVGFGLADTTLSGLAPVGVFRSGEQGNLALQERSSTPADPTSGAEAKIYVKTDKLVIQFNDGGTVRYKYLDLTGTGVTWVHTTSAP